MNLTKYLIDQKFVSEMKEYAEIVNELLKYGKDEAAYGYKLCFYAQLIGFMNKNFSIFGANFKKVSNTLSIDKQILDDINLHLTSKEVLREKNSDSIYYCYQEGRKFKCYNTEKVFNQLLQLHMTIASASFEREEKKNCIQLKKSI